MGLLDFLFKSKSPGAVRLHPGRGWTVDLVGESNYQSAIGFYYRDKGRPSSDLKCEAELEPEKANPHDPNAIRVKIAGLTVGYLPRDLAKQYREQVVRIPQLAGSASCSAKIIGGHVMQNGEPAHFGVKLNMRWPPKIYQD